VVAGSYEKFVTKVDEELLTRAEIARLGLNNALALVSIDGDSSIAKIVEARATLSTKDDAGFILENSFLAGMEGEQGITILRQKLLACMPTQGTIDDAFSISSVAIAAQAIAASSLAKFVGSVARGHLDTVVSILIAIRGNTPPAFTVMHMVPLVQECVDRCAHFCVYPPKDQKAPNRVYGVNALQARHDFISKIAAKPTHHGDLNCSSINDFRVFWWLSKSEFSTVVDQVDEIVRTRNGVGDKEGAGEEAEKSTAASSSSCTAGASASKKAKKATESSKQTMSSVMSKFGGF